MKFETTQKYMRALYGNDLFSIGYCGAYYLLYGVEPMAYNAGVYGWNCDYYSTDGVCICTGYRPHGRKVDYNTLAEYNKRAEEIYRDWNIPHNEQVEKIAEIRAEWIAKLVEGCA
jgi:hypothetical protein